MMPHDLEFAQSREHGKTKPEIAKGGAISGFMTQLTSCDAPPLSREVMTIWRHDRHTRRRPIRYRGRCDPHGSRRNESICYVRVWRSLVRRGDGCHGARQQPVIALRVLAPGDLGDEREHGRVDPRPLETFGAVDATREGERGYVRDVDRFDQRVRSSA
jgi:hypothetical protein